MSIVDTSYRRSFALLVRAAVRHWGYFVSGVLSSALGWILPAYKIDAIEPRFLLWVGFALFLVAGFRAFHDVRMRRDELLHDQEPNLEIVFLPKNDHDSRPYLQTLEFLTAPKPYFPSTGSGTAATASEL